MEYNITVSVDDLKLIAAALQELPYRLSQPLLVKLNEQTEQQDRDRAEAQEAAQYRIPTPEEFREAMRKVPRREGLSPSAPEDID